MRVFQWCQLRPEWMTLCLRKVCVGRGWNPVCLKGGLSSGLEVSSPEGVGILLPKMSLEEPLVISRRVNFFCDFPLWPKAS